MLEWNHSSQKTWSAVSVPLKVYRSEMQDVLSTEQTSSSLNVNSAVTWQLGSAGEILTSVNRAIKNNVQATTSHERKDQSCRSVQGKPCVHSK